MMVMNPEIRDALASVISKLGDGTGKLSVQQFICILKELVGVNMSSSGSGVPGSGSGGSSSTSNQNASQNIGQGLGFILLCR